MDEVTTFSFSQLTPLLVIPSEKKVTKKELREKLMHEIFEYYSSPKEIKLRKIENWKRYCTWCKQNRVADSKDSQKKFKRSKMYIKTMSESSLTWLLKHIPANDLYYFTSTGREFSHTGQSYSNWLCRWFEKVIHS